MYYTMIWRYYPALGVITLTWGELRKKTNLPAPASSVQKRLQQGWAPARRDVAGAGTAQENQRGNGDDETGGVTELTRGAQGPQQRSHLTVLLALPLSEPPGLKLAWVRRCGVAPAPGCRGTSPQHPEGQHRPRARGGKKETRPWPSEGLGALELQKGILALAISWEKGAVLGHSVWKDRQEKRAASWRMPLQSLKNPLKSRLYFTRLMILVYFCNSKSTCHSVKFVKLGKIQTVLFLSPSFSIFLV